MPGPLQTLGMHFYNTRNRQHVESVTHTLVKELESWPSFRPDAGLVFGEGPLSGVEAQDEARRAANNKTGWHIYFLGGVKIWDTPYAHEIIPMLRKEHGIEPPLPDEKEGPYMARIFTDTLRKAGGNPEKYTIHIESESRHTKENVLAAAALGAGRHRTISLTTPAYKMRRTMGTVRTVMNPAAFQLFPLWPVEIGVADISHPLAKYMLLKERMKILHPSEAESEYAHKGDYFPLHIEGERARAQGFAQQQAFIRAQPLRIGFKP